MGLNLLGYQTLVCLRISVVEQRFADVTVVICIGIAACIEKNKLRKCTGSSVELVATICNLFVHVQIKILIDITCEELL